MTKKLYLMLSSGLLWLLLPFNAISQQGVIINLAMIDGLDISPDNVFNYQVQSTLPGVNNVIIKGSIHYRSSNLSISYSYTYSLRPGFNRISRDQVHPQWQFSSSALQELFLTYKKLPAGTYEYCVTVTPVGKAGSEPQGTEVYDECLYHQSDDLFLINLIDPENNAKIHEYNPALSWVVNYPFAGDLSYRLKVAEVKQGQNPQNAITRNNAIYDESNLVQNSLVYPVYAKPLQKGQPYAWHVDAYYKGILLGGSEFWKFTIVEDSLFKAGADNTSYVDISKESGKTLLSAVGLIRLKYVLSQYMTDTLSLKIYNKDNKEIKLKGNRLPAVYGDNRYDLNLADSSSLRDGNIYTLSIRPQTGGSFNLLFKYFNPDFIR